jgi:hypothetical protein
MDKSDHFVGDERVFMPEIRVAPSSADTREAQAASQNSTAPGHQVEDQDDQRNHQQNVNQTTGNVEAESQKPQNQNDDKNCPEHIHSFPALRAPETSNPARAQPTHLQTAVNSKQSPAPSRL